jgi:hypothetical protein
VICAACVSDIILLKACSLTSFIFVSSSVSSSSKSAEFLNVCSGYKGRVNVDKDGNPKIVADGEPSMAPENNTDTFEQTFKNSADLLGCFCCISFSAFILSFLSTWIVSAILFAVCSNS